MCSRFTYKNYYFHKLKNDEESIKCSRRLESEREREKARVSKRAREKESWREPRP